MTMAASRQNAFRCTFAFCSATFDSVGLLRKHKINKPEHDYCSRCDEDFENYDAMLLHKVQSHRHIACPICGEDFKSTGGQRMHMTQVSRVEECWH